MSYKQERSGPDQRVCRGAAGPVAHQDQQNTKNSFYPSCLGKVHPLQFSGSHFNGSLSEY